MKNKWLLKQLSSGLKKRKTWILNCQVCFSWTTVLVLNNVGPIIQSERHTIYTCIDLKKCLIQLSLPFRRICTDCLKHRTHGSNIVVWLRKDSSVGYSHQFRFWSQMSILYTGKYYHALYMLSLDLEIHRICQICCIKISQQSI